MTRNKRKFLQILFLQLSLWLPLNSFHLSPQIQKYQILALSHSPVLLPPSNQLLPVYSYPKYGIHRRMNRFKTSPTQQGFNTIQNSSEIVLPILQFLPLTPKPWIHPIPPHQSQVTSKSVKTNPEKSESLDSQWDGNIAKNHIAAITSSKNILDTDITSEAGEIGLDFTTTKNNVKNVNFSSIQEFDIQVIESCILFDFARKTSKCETVLIICFILIT